MPFKVTALLAGLIGLACAQAMSAAGTESGGSSASVPAIVDMGSQAPANAPNILLVMLDDVGFATASTFGGPVPTPNYDKLASQGLRYNRFHTTAMCSPSRAALLTGRNHHRVEMASVQNLSFGQPGYTSVIPDSAATLGDVLGMHGYSTAWFGKNHVTPAWEITPQGPFDRWPTGFGFDYFYGFMDGATDQFRPDLVENTRFVEAPDEADYILDKDLADRATNWLKQQQSITPDKPFFLYLAPGTAHAPLQAPADWLAKFEGQFDQGWDAMREQTFERQKAMGVIPADAELTPRPNSIPAWDSLADKEKAVAARLMEALAAQLAHFDYQFGRIMATIEEMGERENTLVIYIDGDNGAAAESGIHGTTIFPLNNAKSDVDFMYDHLDDIGGPGLFAGIPVGWAWATGAPFQYTKQIASHLGGTRDGLVVSWPGHIEEQGGLREQFLHIIDIAPTIYDLVGITPPETLAGVEQMPFDGVSFAHTFDNPEAEPSRTSQYFEMLGHRAYYQDGWMASTTPPSTPWNPGPVPAPQDYQWELYNLNEDYSQSRDLAGEYPQKLDELRKAFREVAADNNVLPINNNMMARGDSSVRPYATQGKNSFTYYRTGEYLTQASFPSVINRAWSMALAVSIPDSETSGTLITQGSYDSGWGLFMFDSVPTFVYKHSRLPGMQWRLAAPEPLSAGEHRIHVQMTPDSATPGAGANLSMSIDGGEPVTTHLERTVSLFFPFDDGVGIGRDFRQPLTDDYEIPFAFPGEIGPVHIQVSE